MAAELEKLALRLREHGYEAGARHLHSIAEGYASIGIIPQSLEQTSNSKTSNKDKKRDEPKNIAMPKSSKS